MKKGNTENAVWELAKKTAEQSGVSLWDVRFVKEGANYYLRIFIDSDNGITVEDCEKVSRAIDTPLDELDPIEQGYCLEVSSPGLERELTRPEHFEKMKGEKIFIKLFKAADGKKEMVGTLEDYKDNTVFLLTSGGLKEINKKDTALIRAYYDFGGMTENE